MAQGEAALQLGEADAGQAAFGSALEAYQASCSLSDSSAGDDLPGLLHNWGVGLHTISKQAQVRLLLRMPQAAGLPCMEVPVQVPCLLAVHALHVALQCLLCMFSAATCAALLLLHTCMS